MCMRIYPLNRIGSRHRRRNRDSERENIHLLQNFKHATGLNWIDCVFYFCDRGLLFPCCLYLLLCIPPSPTHPTRSPLYQLCRIAIQNLLAGEALPNLLGKPSPKDKLGICKSWEALQPTTLDQL